MDGNWYNFSEIVSIRLLKRKGKETKTKCLMDGNWCNFSEISGSLPCPICTTLKLNEVLIYIYIMSKGCGKGCLVPIRLSNLYLPKTTLHVKLAENYCSTKPIY